MRKPPKILVAILCGLLVIGALCVWVASTLFEWKIVSHRVGLSREAIQNPYLAGELLLRRAGYDTTDTKERLTFTEADFSHGTLVLASHEAFADAAMRYRVVNWVQHGGHLVVPLEGSQADRELLTALGIQTLGWMLYGSDEYVLPVERQRLKIELPMTQVFRIRDQTVVWSSDIRGRFSEALPEAQNTPKTGHISRQFFPEMTHDPNFASPTQPAEDDGQDDTGKTLQPVETVSLYARMRFGQGYVTVGTFSPFLNTRIEKNDQAMLFMRLMTLPGDPRPIRILYAQKYPGLMEWLFAHASEAWLGFALLILAGLWRLVPRFGPLLPEPPPVRPGLLEHLGACGHFLLQRHAYEKLIAPLREEVQHALEEQRHRHPEIQDITALAAYLSGMRTTEIARALTPEPDSHHEFLRRVQTLATLRSLCKKLRKPFSATGVPS